MKKYLLVLLVICVAILAVAYFNMRQNDFRQPEDKSAMMAGKTEGDDGKNIDFKWTIEELGEDEDFIPVGMVALDVAGAVNEHYDLGKFSGQCFEIGDSGWDFVENEISGVICWWAGGGQEVGIFESNGKFEIRKGDIGEGGTDAEGVRGNFRTIFQIESPAVSKSAPTFENYLYRGPAYDGQTAEIDYTYNFGGIKAQDFRTRLEAAIKKAPNFSGHYIVELIGCGSGCQLLAIIDKISGRVNFFPSEEETDVQSIINGIISYRPDSNLLIIEPDGFTPYNDNIKACWERNEKECAWDKKRYFIWDNNQLTQKNYE